MARPIRTVFTKLPDFLGDELGIGIQTFSQYDSLSTSARFLLANEPGR